MKGIVFTEFFHMVENQYGYQMVDKLIMEGGLDSNGIYTSIGTYPHHEMVILVKRLAEKTGIPMSDLLRNFGKHLFQMFYRAYPHFFKDIDNAFDFLECIETYIHLEVKKLYPDAELPRFQTKREGSAKLIMLYTSERRMADLAEGLILACLSHYHMDANLLREPVSPDGSAVTFTIIKS